MNAAGKLVEPTIPARVIKKATLTDDAGHTHVVRRKTPCAARPTERRDTAWVELFEAKSLPLWRRVTGDRRMEVGIHGVMPWKSFAVDKRDRYMRTTQPLFEHPPRVSDVKQGRNRSCSLAVTVVALLQKNPDMVRDLFCDNGDGSVTVLLHPDSVIIQKTVLRSADGVLWWQLLQKAFAVQGWPHDGSHTQACPGGYCDTFMNLLTGRQAYAHEIKLKSDTYVKAMTGHLSVQERDRKSKYSPVERFLVRSIETKLNDNEIVCMSTKPRLPLTAWGIQPEHSYAVIGVRYKKGSHEKIEIEIYEPRGAYTRFLDLHVFVNVAIVLCFGQVR